MSWYIIKRGIEAYRAEGLAGVIRRFLLRLADRVTPPLRLADRVTPPREFWSEYLEWLNFVNAGMLARGNVWCMDHAIRNLPSETPIVEIGSFCGLSTNVITYLKERHNVKNHLITCDRWIFEGAEVGGMLGDSKSITHAEYKHFAKETFLRNVQMFSRNDLPFTIELFSDEFFDAWATFQKREDVFGREIKLGGAISFCYIDGSHSYDFVKRDFENCDRFLEKEGYLLFDDSADGSEWDVCKVVQEVVATERYDLIAKNPNYFFKKK